jgi:hypothetical protein
MITGRGSALDSSIAPATASIRVGLGTSAVPEPSGLIGLATGMVGAGGFALARRRRAAP